MWANTDIIVALITGILAPLLIPLITKQIKKLEAKRQAEIDSAVEAPTIERSLRDELRLESERQRIRAQNLDDAIDEVILEKDKALKELSEWKVAFYKVNADKSRVEWEMMALRNEFEALKAQMAVFKDTKEKMNELTDE